MPTPNLRTTSVINLMNVPRRQQVMLKVRIAEVSHHRSRVGHEHLVIKDNFAISNFIGGRNITAILDGGDVNLFIRAFASTATASCWPNPPSASAASRPRSSRGEFAVPTVVGGMASAPPRPPSAASARSSPSPLR